MADPRPNAADKGGLMRFKHKEFDSFEEYTRWVTLMGERIKLLGLKTVRHPWVVEGGKAVRVPRPKYYVTYKPVPTADGEPPPVTCDKCCTINPSNYQFCGHCGSPLVKP